MQFQSRTILATVALSIGLLSATTGANAALVTALGGQVVNDTDLNITWLANANLAATNTFGLATGVYLGPTPNTLAGSYIYNDGTMTWGGAIRWIGAMNAANYLGYNDWRLPTTTDTVCNGGYNCTGSEMGHLFYNELGGAAHSSITTTHNNANYNLFSNLQSSFYWSGTEAFPGNTSALYAWIFDFNGGLQGYSYKSDTYYAMAVRTGQVAAVPEAQTYALMLAGLGLIGWRARRRG
jgi:hypothetical protein